MSNIIFECEYHGEIRVETQTYEKFGCPKCYILRKEVDSKKEDSESDHWNNINFTRYTKKDSDKRKFVSDLARDRLSISKTKPLSKVIEDFKTIHGDTYDYSKVIYRDSRFKVIITCQIHGDFLQTPPAHIRGQGCPKCQRDSARKSTNQVIQEFLDVHGQKYDYKKVKYKNAKTQVLIICRDHGDFLQTPNTHKNGSGCPRCAISSNAKLLSDLKKDSSEEVISIFKQVHGDRYDYSAVHYLNKKTKLSIICRDHGPFLQTRFAHQQGQGCPICAKKRPKLDQSKIICDFQAIHVDRYDYSKVKYNGANELVTIICSLHGDFQQKPTIHKSGSGCPRCALGRNPASRSTVISNFTKVHGNRYDYSLVHYVNSRTNVKIICAQHGVFEQRPSSHQSGSGCPLCPRSKVRL